MKLKYNIKYFASPSKIFVTVLVLLIALHFLQFMIFGIVMTFERQASISTDKSKQQTALEPSGDKLFEIIRSSDFKFLPDGTIHLISGGRDRHAFRQNKINPDAALKVYDTKADLIWEGPGRSLPYQYLEWPENPRELSDVSLMKEMHMMVPELSRTLNIPVKTDDQIQEFWQYDPVRDIFIGSDIDGRQIGCIGANGFQQSISQVSALGQLTYFTARSSYDSDSVILLWQCEKKIYEVDFEKRQVTTLFESPDSSFGNVLEHNWMFNPISEKDSIRYRPLLLCKTDDGFSHLIMRDPDQLLTVKVPDDKNYTFTATDKYIFAYYRGSDIQLPQSYRGSVELANKWCKEMHGKTINHWLEFYKVTSDDEFVKLNRLDWSRIFQYTPSAVFSVSENLLRYLSSLSPALYDSIWNVFGEDFWRKVSRTPGVMDAVSSAVRELRPAKNALCWTLSAIMMALVVLHGLPRRTSWAGLLFWVFFAGVFNLAGLLTYLALNHTPFIKCPACHKTRGFERLDCVSCHTPLPKPQQKNTDLLLSMK